MIQIYRMTDFKSCYNTLFFRFAPTSEHIPQSFGALHQDIVMHLGDTVRMQQCEMGDV